MTTHRSLPTVDVGSLAKILVGDRLCLWSVWFAAHHADFDRVPSDFDGAAWRIAHTAMLRDAAEALNATYPTVRREYQNVLKVRRGNIIVSGRADLVGLDPEEVLVEDVKTGRSHAAAHVAQTKSYMVLAPLIQPVLAGRRIRGRVRYQDGFVEIDPLDPDDPFISLFWDLVDRIGSDTPPERVPSFRECRYSCPVTVADCPDRIEVDDDSDDSWDIST